MQSKQAQYLNAGDIVGNNEKVIAVYPVPFREFNAGRKVNILLENSAGTRYMATWNKTTKIAIKVRRDFGYSVE